jgi:CubicO group peptidase (beta-lactamase class C family)
MFAEEVDRMRRTLIVLCAVVAGLGAGVSAQIEVALTEDLVGFEVALDALRVSHDIPGMSAALVSGGEIVWSKGFGYSDPQSGAAATPSTSYHLASLTKPYAAVLLMQLVEQGLVDLDEPISQYGIDLDSEGTILIRHLLNHTSHDVPGDSYQYDGSRFGRIGAVFEVATGKTFGELLVEKILRPLGLVNTAPNVEDAAFDLAGLDRDEFRANMALPYAMGETGLIRSAYRGYFGPAAGMIGSVEDMALFSIAIDERRFLTEAATDLMFTPAVSNSGAVLPYAIGWFVTSHRGIELQWHYGLWDATSTLIVRAPERDLAFVVMANTDAMSSRHRGLGAGDLLDSPFARLFLDSFVDRSEHAP